MATYSDDEMKQMLKSWRPPDAQASQPEAVNKSSGLFHLSCWERQCGEQAATATEAVTVCKDLLHDAEHALRLGLAYARQCLSDHKAARGRATHKDALLAESMEREVRQIEAAHEALRKALAPPPGPC